MSGSMEQLVQNRKENCFLLMVTGQIETVEFISLSNVYCKYFFVYGADWRQVGGPEEGITPTGYKRAKGSRITLSTPIESTFSSTNPFNWPQIVLSFYGCDLFGNDVVRGYSATHLPTVPGSTKRKCPIFLPQTSTAVQRLLSLFTGRRTEFVDPKIVAMAEGRDVTRVTTHGFVHLSLTATLRDSKKFGYELSHQMVSKISEFPLGLPPTENTVSSKNSKPTVTKEKTTETAQEHEEQQLHMLQPQSHVQIKHE